MHARAWTVLDSASTGTAMVQCAFLQMFFALSMREESLGRGLNDVSPVLEDWGELICPFSKHLPAFGECRGAHERNHEERRA